MMGVRPGNLKVEKISVTANTDGAGASEGNTDSTRIINGRIVKIYLDHGNSPASGTDTTIKTKNSPQETVLSLTDDNSDGWFYPRKELEDDTGGTVAAGDKAFEKYFVNDKINVAIADANSSQTLTAYIYHH